ncbi:hypothetical protein EJ04DRAFT_135301, partial [Polyplosphaeria fusca]
KDKLRNGRQTVSYRAAKVRCKGSVLRGNYITMDATSRDIVIDIISNPKAQDLGHRYHNNHLQTKTRITSTKPPSPRSFCGKHAHMSDLIRGDYRENIRVLASLAHRPVETTTTVYCQHHHHPKRHTPSLSSPLCLESAQHPKNQTSPARPPSGHAALSRVLQPHTPRPNATSTKLCPHSYI